MASTVIQYAVYVLPRQLQAMRDYPSTPSSYTSVHIAGIPGDSVRQEPKGMANLMGDCAKLCCTFAGRNR